MFNVSKHRVLLQGKLAIVSAIKLKCNSINENNIEVQLVFLTPHFDTITATSCAPVITAYEMQQEKDWYCNCSRNKYFSNCFHIQRERQSIRKVSRVYSS